MSFSLAIKFTLQHEGGYVNDPKDPGGETNFGISKRAYPSLDIKNLTEHQAKNIYFKDYWLAAGCDKLESKLAICVFDAAVNLGLKKAKLFLETAKTAESFNNKREDWYIHLKERFPQYFKGWMNRLNALRKFVNES